MNNTYVYSNNFLKIVNIEKSNRDRFLSLIDLLWFIIYKYLQLDNPLFTPFPFSSIWRFLVSFGVGLVD